MISIRARLSVILIAATGLIWLFAAAWIYLSTQKEVERVLDARLIEAARMVSSLIDDHRVAVAAAAEITAQRSGEVTHDERSYNRQLSCQIWSLDGALVGRSEGAPPGRLAEHAEGFQETEVDGETWRVYAMVNERLGVRVLVGDNMEIRERLVGDVVRGLMVPALLILPLMAVLIWLCVGRGLAPLNHLAAGLARREATDLHPIAERPVPSEIRPMIAALNGLFRRVGAARERERNFTAFAAHELKTPLAGLKTQAQIAMLSEDEKTRGLALQQIALGVDRTARLARQLLDLAAAEGSLEGQGEVTSADGAAPLRQVVEDARLSLEALAECRGVTISLSGDGLDHRVESERALLTVAIRNLLENAVQFAAPGGQVACRVDTQPEGLVISIADDGPGIDGAELTRATQRFFRGARRSTSGSGLGLSIVEVVADRLGGGLVLENRPQGGLLARLSIRAPGGSWSL